MLEDNERSGAEEIRLPVDLRTIAAGLWRRRGWFLLVAVVAAAAGVAAGLAFGKRTYVAETLLRYSVVGKAAPANALQTIQNEIKILGNLERTRERLGLPAALDTLGASIDARVGRDANLLIIKASWNDPDVAAAVANTLRDVYLETWMRGQLALLDRMQSQVGGELKSLSTQADRLGAVIEDLRKQASAEQDAAAKAGRGGNLGFRFQRLREAIQEDQTRRANQAELAKRELDVERARNLRSQDLISPAEYDRTLAAYKSQQALTLDTSRTRQWRNELDQIAGTLAKGGQEASPTLNLLNSTLYKSFDLDLQRTALQQKVQELDATRDQIARALAGSTPKGEGGAQPTKPLDLREVQQMLVSVLTTNGADGAVLEVVSPATPPISSTKSTRKLLAAAVAVGLFLLGSGLLVGGVVLSPTARSGAELRTRLEVPVLGVLPAPRKKSARKGAESPEREMVEAARLLAERVWGAVGGAGAKILVTSPGRGDGRSLVAVQLAAALGRRGEEVVLVDGALREPRSPFGLEALAGVNGSSQGLGELLRDAVEHDRAEVSPPAPPRGEGGPPDLSDHRRWLPPGSLEDLPPPLPPPRPAPGGLRLLLPTSLARVRVLPRGKPVDSPELLGSAAMDGVLAEITPASGVVLLDGPPVLPRVDAEYLAHRCDAVVLVVRAGVTPMRTARRALKRLKASGVPVAGAVLNGVDAPYVDLD